MDETTKLEARYQELYSKLNENQKTAVDTIEGPVMVVAGPGTGKTQTISLRIANILRETQLDPHNILCLTFTDTAVNTMRRRLLEIIGEAAYDIRIYTFHGFCNEVIQAHLEKFQEFGAKSEPLGDIDKFKVFSGLLDQMPYDSMLKPFGNTEAYIWEIPSLISGFKKDNISPDAIEAAVAKNLDFANKTGQLFKDLKAINYRQLSNNTFVKFINDLQSLGFSDFAFVEHLIKLVSDFQGDRYSQLRNEILKIFDRGFSADITTKQQEFINIFRNYQLQLKVDSKYDYDDMIQGVVNRFTNDKELLSEYQERFQYILVDEFQDTNSSQNEVIRLLGSFWTDPNIFVVGDDDQSIFRFQGASVENMRTFYNTYLSKIRVISLIDNYRSQQLVLDSARALISHNGLQINEMIPNLSKELKAFHQEYPKLPVNINEFKDPIQEARVVAEKIKEKIQNGVPGKEIAVIFRDNADQADIREALAALRIDFRMEKGEDILNHAVVQQLLNLLGYIIDPENCVSLFQILNYKFTGLDAYDLAKFYGFAYQNKIKYSELLVSQEHLTAAGIKTPEKFLEFGQKLLAWRQDIYNHRALNFFNKLIRDSGYLTYLLQREDRNVVMNKLSRLYQELKNLARGEDNFTLVDFVEDLKVYKKYGVQLNDKLWGIDNDNAVRLMTAHGAKGQEFEEVFVIRAQDKKWGNKMSMNRIRPPFGLLKNQLVTDDNDEERRLFYVAMTRAKKELHISYSRFNNKQKEQNPSKFLQEIPEAYVNKQTVSRDDATEAQQFQNVIEIVHEQNFTTEAQEILHNLLHDYKLNVSNVIAYRHCPRCFYFHNILKVPDLPGKSAALGSAIHEAIRNLMDTLNQTGVVPQLELLLSQFITTLKQQKLEEKDFLESMQQGELILTDFYRAKVAANTFVKGSLNELNFKHTEVTVNGVPISGKIDRVDFLDPLTGALMVVDYKTGNPDNAGAKLSINNLGDYYLQLVYYKLLIENSHLVKGFAQTGRIEFLAKSRASGTFVNKDFVLDQSAVEPVLALIKSTYESIMALDFARMNTDGYNACSTPEFHDLEWKF